MSSKIDQRIVEMSFENHKFEKGILESKNSLKEFSGALDSLGRGKDFGGLENSIRSITSSFSMLEQIGIGVLRRIGESAIDAGAKIFKHLTIDPLKMGWGKYEQKTASVQTIMNATGKSIDEVNKYLNKLMWFSDETSYGFTDMTAALAQMTSSGGDIDTLIPLITGVANATAYAGKGATEFSRAMYNLNQSYGSGNLQFMDWRSLELAGVAGQDLKQVFIDTAKAIGMLDQNGRTAKGTLVNIGNFGSTLQEKWANTEVMEKAFGKFSELSEAAYELVNNGTYETAAEAMEALTGQYSELAEKGFKSAQQAKTFSEAINATLDAVSSGWMRTYEIIFGEMDEAIHNFTNLTEILWTAFAAGAGPRNEMLLAIKDAGGVAAAFQAIKNVAIALLKPLRAVSKGFDKIFPPKTKKQWVNLLKTVESLTSGLIITDETASKIERTFAGLFAVVDIGWTTIKFLGNSFLELVKIFMPVGDSLLDITAAVGDFLVGLNKTIKSSNAFTYGMLAVKIAAISIRNALQSVISTVSDFARGLWNAEKPLEYIGEMIKKVFGTIIDSFKMGAGWISEGLIAVLSDVSSFIKNILGEDTEGVLSGILSVLKELIDVLTNGVTSGLKGLTDAVDDLDLNKIAAFVTGGILLLFINQLTQLTKSMTGIINTTNTFLTKFSKKLFGTTTKIKDVAVSFGILAASLYVLSTIPWPDLIKGIAGLASAMILLVGAYALLQTINVKATNKLNGKAMAQTTFNLMGMASGLLVMATALKIIGGIDENAVGRSTAVLGAMMAFLVGYQALYILISTIPGHGKLSVSMTSMAVGLLGLIGAVVILNKIKLSDIANGMAKMTAILLMIGGIQAMFSVAARMSYGTKLATSMLGISGGILALIGVMKLITLVDVKELSKGIGNLFLLGGVLAGLELLFGLAGSISGANRFKSNILTIGLGMLTMIGLIAILDKMNDSDINVDNGIKVLAKMAGIIGAIELLTALSSKISGGAKVQRILGAVTVTMISFIGLIKVISIFTDSEIDRGLLIITKMAGIIVAIELLTALIGKIGGTKGSFAVMIGIVTALLTLTASIALLSIIDQADLRQAVISLGIASAAVAAISVGLGIMIKALSLTSGKLSNFKGLAKGLLSGLSVLIFVILSTLVLLETIKRVIPILEGISWSNLGKFTLVIGSVGAIVLSFTKLMDPKLGNWKSSLKSLIPGFAALVGVIAATAGIFYVLSWILPLVKDVSWDSFGKFIVGITAISGLVTALALLGPKFVTLGKGFGHAIGGVVAAILGVGLIVAAFAGLSVMIEKMSDGKFDILVNGMEKLILVGNGIGRFVGAMIGGVANETLVEIGKGLSGFAEALDGIEGKSFDGVKELAGALLVLTGSSILSGLSRIVNLGRDPVKIFGKQLIGIVSAFQKISISEASKTADVLRVLGPVAKNLKDLADAADAIPNSGGFLGFLIGNNDIHKFGSKLGKFISALGPNIVSVAGAEHASLILEALTPVAKNLKDFAKASDAIPNTGGLLSKLVGDNTIDQFALDLTKMISTFKKLDVTNDITPASDVLAAMTPMTENLKEFIVAADSIPNSDGFVTIFTGDNNLKVFTENIAEMVPIFGMISDNLLKSAIDKLGLMSKELLPSIGKFARISNNLNASGGLKQAYEGNTTLNEFAWQMVGFVNALKGINITATEADKANEIISMFAPMASNIKQLIEVASSIPSGSGFATSFLDKATIDAIGVHLVELVNALKILDIQNDIKPATESLIGMTPIASELKKFITVAKSLPNTSSLVTFATGSKNIKAFVGEIADMIPLLSGIDSVALSTVIKNLTLMGNDLLPTIGKFSKLSNELDPSGGLKQLYSGNTTLSEFAFEIVSFIRIFKGVDFSVVEPALASLEQIKESFTVLGANVIESAAASFRNNKTLFHVEITSILDEANRIIQTKGLSMISNITGIFKEGIKQSEPYIKDFKKIGVDIVLGLRDGIISQRSSAINAIAGVSKDLETTTRKVLDTDSPSKIFTDIGGWIPKSLGLGIRRNARSASLAGILMAEDIEEAVRDTMGIHSFSPDYGQIGEYVPLSITEGMSKTQQFLINKANELGLTTVRSTLEGAVEGVAESEGLLSSIATNLLDLLTSSDKSELDAIAKSAGKDAGESFMDSYADGISGSSSAATSAYKGVAKDAFQIFKESIDERKEYNLISAAEEIAEWENFAKKYAEGTKIRLKADKELGRLRFEYSKTWIDEEKYYKRLSLLDELAAWERVQKRYAEGHAYRMQAERELFRLKEEIKRAEYQNSMDWINEEKYYNRLSLTQELAAWKRVQSRYKEFEDNNTKSSERKEAEHEIYRLEKEINDKRIALEEEYYNKTKEINDKLKDDVDSLNEKYDDALQNRTQTLISTWGLFDEVTKSDEQVTGKQLLSNLEGQVIEFSNWRDQLDVLGSKGVTKGLMSELEAMGPRSLAQIKALNQLSGPELDRYVMLWQKKHRQAKKQATEELVDLRIDTNKQIAELTNTATKELEEYRKVWEQSMAEISEETKASTENTTTNVISTIKDFSVSTIGMFKVLNSDIVKTLKDENWEEVGKQIPIGIARGITMGIGFVLTAARLLTRNTNNTTNEGFEINSPSKVGIRIGENYAHSIGSGMLNMLKFIGDASYTVSDATVSIMSDVLSGIGDLLDNDYDLEPTITPVLDMNGIEDSLTKAFSAKRSVSLSDIALKSADGIGLQEIATASSKRRRDILDRDTPTNNIVNNKDESKIQIVNNYSVRNDNDIRKISRDQKNLLDRYNLARGVTT